MSRKRKDSQFRCIKMSMNASKNFLLRRISSLPHSEDFRLQMYKELFIPTTHWGTTRGYYGLMIINPKKCLFVLFCAYLLVTLPPK